MVPSRNYVLIQTQTITASGTSPIIVPPADFSSCIIALVSGAVTGTSPTLNVYIQEAFRVPAATDVADISTAAGAANYTVFDDAASFAQITTAGTQILRWTGGGNAMNAVGDAALTAGTVRNGPLGQAWRIKWVVAGTSPSFTSVSMWAKFIF